MDAVVVDAVPARRPSEVEQLRTKYDGRIVVLLDQRDDERDLPQEPKLLVMRRPFAMLELWNVLTGPARLGQRRWGRSSPPKAGG